MQAESARVAESGAGSGDRARLHMGTEHLSGMKKKILKFTSSDGHKPAFSKYH